MLTTTPLQ